MQFLPFFHPDAKPFLQAYYTALSAAQSPDFCPLHALTVLSKGTFTANNILHRKTKLPLRLPHYTDLVIKQGEIISDQAIQESEATMKRRIIVTLTGITMSAMLITTGCAGSTGAGTTSQTESTVTADQAADSAQAGNSESADQKSDSAQADAAGKPDSSGSSEANSPSAKKQKPGSSTEKPGSSAEATEELKTVEPSAYAGQTVCGKVTAINDSQITVTLGTYKEKFKKSSSESGTTDSNTTDPNTADSGANTPNTTAPNTADPDSNAPSTSTAPANGNAGITEASRGKTGQGKKSSFTSSGEQMTVTIPDSLSDVEIKENYVLSITLDENGSVTAVEVKSKGRNRSGSNQPSSGSKPEKGSNSGNNTITDTDGTTQL